MPDVNDLICNGFRETTHTGTVEDGSRLFELPLSYVDGAPIEVIQRPDGSLTDNGNTLLRLLSRGRLAEVEAWPWFGPFCRTHFMARDAAEFVFKGNRPSQFIRFLEGIRELDLKAPGSRDRSTAFDDLVRGAVKRVLDTAVRKSQISKQDATMILHPNYLHREKVKGEVVDVSIRADFVSRDRRRLVVVLSHGGASDWERTMHIRAKLAEHALLRNSSKVETVPVIPADSEYGEDENRLIKVLSGRSAIELNPERNIRPLTKVLLETDGPFKPNR